MEEQQLKLCFPVFRICTLTIGHPSCAQLLLVVRPQTSNCSELAPWHSLVKSVHMAKYIIYLWLNFKCHSQEVLSAGLHRAVSCSQPATNLSSGHGCFQCLFSWSDRIRNVSVWNMERSRLRPDGNIRAESCDHVTGQTAHAVLTDPGVERPHTVKLPKGHIYFSYLWPTSKVKAGHCKHQKHPSRL